MYCKRHRWARLLKQRKLIIVYRLPAKENKPLFDASIFRIYIEMKDTDMNVDRDTDMAAEITRAWTRA